MLSLHLNQWLEWKCRSAAPSVGLWVFCTGLLRVPGLLLCGSSCLGRISLGWNLFGGA